MATISKVYARQILDSRGNPTVECDITLSDGRFGRAAVPSGASTGEHEALELRDGDAPFGGKGVLKAVANVNDKIGPAVIGMDALKQSEIDKKMMEIDGTPNKSALGANAILAVSIAVAKAVGGDELFRHIGDLFGNAEFGQPRPMINVLNGGAHSNNGLSIQEFMIIPIAETISERIRIAAEIFQKLKKYIDAEGMSTAVGDEGGFAPDIKRTRDALDLLMRAGEGYDMKLGLDVAASEFFKNGSYLFDGTKTAPSAMLDHYKKFAEDYPIISIEDGFDQNDWDGWGAMTGEMGGKCQLVGDDLFCTNPARIKKGIEAKVANAVLIKLNQIGSLTETLEAIRMAKDAGYGAIISHRSGETEDTFIADLAVGTNAGQIKTGSMSRSERICKYNRLLRIEEKLK